MKKLLSNIFFTTGVSWFFFKLSRFYYGKAHIRVVNYHSTPIRFEVNLEQQLKFYSKYYVNTTAEDLQDFLFRKKWKYSKPGIIISFDDGLANNEQIALPLLTKYNFTAWFCIPCGFIKTPVNEQFEFAKNHSISLFKVDNQTSIAINIDKLKSLSRNNVVLSHTTLHTRLSEQLTEEKLELELINSKNDLQNIINQKVEGFCWVGGETNSYSAKAEKFIKQHYKFAFRTNNLPITFKTDPYKIERTNIESWFSFPLFLFTLSGIYDVMYFPKRVKLKRKMLE